MGAHFRERSPIDTNKQKSERTFFPVAYIYNLTCLLVLLGIWGSVVVKALRY
jgi:hypothetical protein